MPCKEQSAGRGSADWTQCPASRLNIVGLGSKIAYKNWRQALASTAYPLR